MTVDITKILDRIDSSKEDLAELMLRLGNTYGPFGHEAATAIEVHDWYQQNGLKSNYIEIIEDRACVVARISGVDYINDSKATNVDAAIASVLSVTGRVVLIAGGQGKGGDFDHLARSIHEKLRAAVVIGEDADLVATALDHLAPVYRASSLSDALSTAKELANSGDTVLLAPACASFDKFDNFMQRGDNFCSLVRGLAE